MTETEINHWARRVAQRLLVIQEGGMDDPATWAAVAKKRGYSVEYFHDPAAGPGEYVSCEAGTGCIRINTAHRTDIQARALVHECAHALLSQSASGEHWGGQPPGELEGQYAVSRYDGTAEPGDVRHRIARQVEAICFRRL